MATRQIRNRSIQGGPEPSTRVLTASRKPRRIPTLVRQREQRRIGDYEVIGSLGQGGMGEVLLARRRGTTAVGYQSLVAVKRLLPHVLGDDERIGMFIDEARICSRLSHSNIAQVIEFGEEQGCYFLAMEYVHGVSVKHLLAELEELPPPAVTAYTVGCVCAALHHAHTRVGDAGEPLRIIHRDVNPNNVMIGADGQVKLIDFGVAKAADRIHHTLGATIKGSYAYMSPEQAAAEPLDHRSDLFSCGTLLYVMLTGVNPFVGNSVLQTLELVRMARVPPPSAEAPGVPAELERICLRALSADRTDRYGTAELMQHELELFCHQRTFGDRDLRAWIRAAVPSLTDRVDLDDRERVDQDAIETMEAPALAESAEDSLRTLEDLPRGPGGGELQGTEELGTGDLIDPVTLQGSATRPAARPLRPSPATEADPAARAPVAAERGGARPWGWPVMIGLVLLMGSAGVVVWAVAFAPESAVVALPPRRPAGRSVARPPGGPAADSSVTDAPGAVVPSVALGSSGRPSDGGPDSGRLADAALASSRPRSYAPARGRRSRHVRGRVGRRRRSMHERRQARPAAKAPPERGTGQRGDEKLGDRGAVW